MAAGEMLRTGELNLMGEACLQNLGELAIFAHLWIEARRKLG